MSKNRQHFTRTAEEPSGEVYGRHLYWDSTYHVFSLVNNREEETKVVDLGPFKSAVLRLQHEFGLTSGQANQAALTAMGAFNDGVNLDVIQRIANAPDEGHVQLVAELSMRLGENVPSISDEEIVAEAVKLARIAEKTIKLIENGMINFRYALSEADRVGREDIGRQIIGMRKLAEITNSILADGFSPSGDTCFSPTDSID